MNTQKNLKADGGPPSLVHGSREESKGGIRLGTLHKIEPLSRPVFPNVRCACALSPRLAPLRCAIVVRVRYPFHGLLCVFGLTARAGFAGCSGRACGEFTMLALKVRWLSRFSGDDLDADADA